MKRRRRPQQFSATKAVKSNARDRVGQPKPSRIVEEKPRNGRHAKYKEQKEDLLRWGE